MTYDEGLAERIRDILPKATEKKMFGGVGWMERGNMVAGIRGDDLLIRQSEADTPKVLKEKGTKGFEVGGRVSRGWILVEPEAIAEEPELKQWIERSRKYVATLPAK